MSQLKTLGVVLDGTKQAAAVFTEIFPDFRAIKAKSPSEYVSIFWKKYESRKIKNKDLNGKIFEYLLATVFVREGLVPFFLNAKVAFVPNVNFDLMFYTSDRGPVCISAKTSLRERYKQADLEAIALKYVHRKALSFLVTLDDDAALKVKQKIKSGDVIGLEDVVVARSTEFDDLISDLRNFTLCKPKTVAIVTSTYEVTKEKVALL
jgi:hypothetical protein